MNLLTKILKICAKVATWVLAIVTILAAYGGHIPPFIWADPSILVLIYPYLALLTLIAGVLWFIFRKIFTGAVCIGALLLCGGTFFDYFPLRGSKDPKPGEQTFTIMTYNILHGKDIRLKEGDEMPVGNEAIDFVLEKDADIVCLQEFFGVNFAPGVTDTQKENVNDQYPHFVATSHGEAALMTLSKYPVSKLKEGMGYLLTAVNVRGTTIYVLNVHLASYKLSEEQRGVITRMHGVKSAESSLREFKGSIRTKLKDAFAARGVEAQQLSMLIEETPGPLIVCGDFNDVPGSWAYRVVKGKVLDDAYSQTNTGMMSTYNMYGFYFRIDQMLYRPERLRALSLVKGDIDTSDHFPLIAEFAYIKKPR